LSFFDRIIGHRRRDRAFPHGAHTSIRNPVMRRVLNYEWRLWQDRFAQKMAGAATRIIASIQLGFAFRKC
jgi:hypothetical protein